MKKVIAIFLMSLLLPCTQAKVTARTQQMIVMGGQYNDPHNEKKERPRTPVSPIYVNQDEHTFTFNTSFAGEVVEVLRDETLLSTTVVGTDGNVVLSDDISGEVEIRLVRECMTYSATVSL